MPQINRIRVNNVKYNFGTQFYDDFLMRFSCRNTIYDLANGGGKSVLMLLLLQTVIPNCTLDDKQPVEKLFRTNSGSTTIHSLVEWKLDACDVKNGYRYMTCGFCARKGREQEDENISSDSASIEYFNYCIFYREFGDNDIKNLPLANGNERITYNGLKNYLKDLERKDFNVQVKIFEKKSDYQSYINQYGIYESQWEIIRGINKTEGHVRTYFESNYKTTRKVVEDLLIEEIIEKSYNNRIRNGNGDDEMARTLLDIKDKLLELSKRKEDMDSYDRQIELLKDFSGRIETFASVYSRKEALKTTMLTFLSEAKGKMAYEERSAAALLEKVEQLKNAIQTEEMLIAAADIAEEKKELEELKNLVSSMEEKLALMAKERDDQSLSLKLAQTAADYEDYKEYKKMYAELKEFMDNRHKDRGGIAEEMKGLSAAKYLFIAERSAILEERSRTLETACGELKAGIDQLRTESRNYDNERAKAEGIAAHLSADLEDLTQAVREKMQGTTLLVSENATEEAEKLKAEAEKLLAKEAVFQEESEELQNKENYCVKETAATEARLTLLMEQLERLEKERKTAEAEYEKLAALGKVYGEREEKRLLAMIENIHDGMLRDRERLANSIKQLTEFTDAVKNGVLPKNTAYTPLLEYLDSRYEGKVKTGSAFLEGLASQEQIQMLEKYPFLPYAIIICEDYDVIINDKSVMGFDNMGVVPFLREEAIQEENLIEPELSCTLVCRDLSFIYDEAGRSAGMKSFEEEIDRLKAELYKVQDRLAVVKKDYDFINAYGYSAKNSLEEINGQIADSKKETLVLEEKKTNLYKLKETLSGRYEEVSQRQKEISGKRKALEEQYRQLLDISELNLRIDGCLSGIEEAKNLAASAIKGKKSVDEILTSREKIYGEKQLAAKQLEEESRQLKNRWDKDYLLYYDEKAEPAAGMTEDAIDARFDALRQLIAQELGDISDKERLMENYRQNMDRVEQAMEYRGIDVEEASRLFAEGRLSKLERSEMVGIRESYDAIVKQMEAEEENLNAASAQMNRVEGGIAHAQRSLAEKYGDAEPPVITNPKAFRMEHKNQLNHNKALLTETAKEEKEAAKKYNGCMLMEKDLERIVKSMGINPDSVAAFEISEDKDLEVGEYEEAAKAFDQILNEERKKREGFLKEKDLLTDTLTALHAFELSEELKRSIVVPENMVEAERLIQGISDTNDCIALERDRIGRGIEDMKRIKDNFENRCIQICSNIRTELERLPKLSRITLDEEVIPIVSLQIPYIKEELYKDRMSVYINETVSAAENFNSMEEKLKYIKGRLTWKRLFSVIITDMNSIKLNLYKRERIKDQSRYLRYEEAVGSTGQSQGIYIQFLVAVINYIANMNAGGKEASILGKTIFIDNPFGAAKDVYIWEPIFKLLKTNHVQLIVPARGATPAITGRFDINYILGQKLVGSRQQTVVVDYRSQVNESELEYERLSFSQESFDFL